MIISPLFYFNADGSYEINFSTKKVYMDFGLFKWIFSDLENFDGIDRAYASPERTAFFYRLRQKSDRYVKCIPISGLIECSDKHTDEVFRKNVIARFTKLDENSERCEKIPSDVLFIYSYFWDSRRYLRNLFEAIYVGTVGVDNKFTPLAGFDKREDALIEKYLDGLRQKEGREFRVEYIDNRMLGRYASGYKRLLKQREKMEKAAR
jgi:hypothetical protein